MAERQLLRMTRIARVDLVDKGASYDPATGEGAHVLIHKRADSPVDKAEWTAAYINDLPDSSFAVISAGGEKDDEGKTTPRSLRSLPYKDANGKVDLPHLRNALSRLPQTDLTPAEKAKATAKLNAAAKAAQVGEPAAKGWWITSAETVMKLWRAIHKDDYGGDAMLPTATTFEDALRARTMDEVMGALGAAFGALWETICSALEDDTVPDKAGAISAALDSFGAEVQSEVGDWLGAGPDVAKIGRKIAGARLTRMQAAHKALGAAHKALGSVIHEAQEGTIMSGDVKKGLDLATLPEPVRKHVEGLTARVTELETELAKRMPPDPWAGVSADVRKRIEEQDAEIKKLREQNEQAVYVTKAAAFKGLPIKPDDDWKMLKALDTLPADVAKRAWELLRAGDAAMLQKGGVFQPTGADLRGTGTAGGDAWAKIEAGAAERVAKSARPISKHEAIDEFLQTPEGKRLYQEYLGQNPAQTGGR